MIQNHTSERIREAVAFEDFAAGRVGSRAVVGCVERRRPNLTAPHIAWEPMYQTPGGGLGLGVARYLAGASPTVTEGMRGAARNFFLTAHGERLVADCAFDAKMGSISSAIASNFPGPVGRFLLEHFRLSDVAAELGDGLRERAAMLAAGGHTPGTLQGVIGGRVIPSLGTTFEYGGVSSVDEATYAISTGPYVLDKRKLQQPNVYFDSIWANLKEMAEGPERHTLALGLIAVTDGTVAVLGEKFASAETPFSVVAVDVAHDYTPTVSPIAA